MERWLATLNAGWRDFLVAARRTGGEAAVVLAAWWRTLVTGLAGTWSDTRRWLGERQLERAERASRTNNQNAKTAARGRTEVAALPGDDVATILGRIDSAEDSDLILVVPRGVASLRTPSAWARVAGHVRRRGLHLQVVASRGEVRDYARQTGFEAARSRGLLTGYPRSAARLGDIAIPLPAIDVLRALQLAAIAGIVGVGLGVGCWMVPSAQLVVVPRSLPVSQVAEVRVSALAERVDPLLGELPATTFRNETSAVITVPATGSVLVGVRPAVARVEFQNATESPLDLPAGTVVHDGAGTRFLTRDRLAVPPGERAAIDTEAEAAGTAGNVAPGTLVAAEGIPPGVTVTNPAAAAGGADGPTTAVAQADVDRAAALAEEVLSAVGLRALNAQAGAATLFPETASVLILTSEPYRNLDEPASTFIVEYTAQVTVLGVSDAHVETFGSEMLQTRLGQRGRVLPGRTTAEFSPRRRFEGGVILTSATFNGQYAASFDERAIASSVTGARPGAARDRVAETLDLVQPAEVRIEPAWVPWLWMPRRADRITVVIGDATPPTPENGGGANDADEQTNNPSSTAHPRGSHPSKPTQPAPTT